MQQTPRIWNKETVGNLALEVISESQVTACLCLSVLVPTKLAVFSEKNLWVWETWLPEAVGW